jgi:hypothetical protein
MQAGRGVQSPLVCPYLFLFLHWLKHICHSCETCMHTALSFWRFVLESHLGFRRAAQALPREPNKSQMKMSFFPEVLSFLLSTIHRFWLLFKVRGNERPPWYHSGLSQIKLLLTTQCLLLNNLLCFCKGCLAPQNMFWWGQGPTVLLVPFHPDP